MIEATSEYYELVKPRPAMRDVDVCWACNGARYVRYERPVGHMLFGKYTPCPQCSVSNEEQEAAPWAK